MVVKGEAKKQKQKEKSIISIIVVLTQKTMSLKGLIGMYHKDAYFEKKN